MSIYQLTRKELWTLATIINLPIEEGSIIGEWLGLEEQPAYETIESWIKQSVNTLKAKGYLSTRNGQDEFLQDFLDALLITSMGQEQILTTLRTGKEAAEARFTYAGTGFVQYGVKGDTLILHQPKKLDIMLSAFIPNWIQVQNNEDARLQMPFGAFLLFKQACLERDIAEVLNDDSSAKFSRAALIDGFVADNGWLDFYHALGITTAPALDALPLADYLNQLVNKGILEAVDGMDLKIGEAGHFLAETLSDPDQVSISFGLTSLPREMIVTSAFLYGAGRLFRLDFLNNEIVINQQSGHAAAVSWLRDLLKPAVVHKTVLDDGRTQMAEDIAAVDTGPLTTWQLEFITGVHSGNLITLTGDMTLGRSDANDIVIKDNLVSRQHAKLVRSAQGYTLVDLGSSNGTFLNEDRIHDPHLLTAGEVIRLGAEQMLVKRIN